MVGALLAGCSRTPVPTDSPYTEIVCTRTDTSFVNDTTFVNVNDTTFTTVIDTIVYTDTTHVVIEDTNQVVVILFNDVNVGVRVDKGNEKLEALDFAEFIVPYDGKYELKAEIEYSGHEQGQFNESFYLTVGGEGALDSNTGAFRTVPDLNTNSSEIFLERYCGTWYIVAGMRYNVSLHHYYLIANLYPEFFNGSWSVESVHLKSLTIRKVQ